MMFSYKFDKEYLIVYMHVHIAQFNTKTIIKSKM